MMGADGGSFIRREGLGCCFSRLPWEDSDLVLSGGWLNLTGHGSVVALAKSQDQIEAEMGTHLEPVCWKQVELIIKSWL